MSWEIRQGDAKEERVAKALHEDEPWLYGQTSDGEDVYLSWAEAPPSVKDYYRKQARAAISALEEGL